MNDFKKILVIAAHPDDDILGCGGLLFKYSKTCNIRVIFIAEGSSCRFTLKQLSTPEVIRAIEQRNNFGKDALGLLGINNYKFYNLPCGRLDQVPIIDINKIIEKEILEFMPDTIFTHSNNDANNDHLIVHRATIMATRPIEKTFVFKLYAFEILSSSEWKFTKTFEPNYFEILDIQCVNMKWQALSKYETEVKSFPYPRSKEGLVTQAKFRGLQCGNQFAEAFKLIREINK